MLQEQERPQAVYAISMAWFRQWQAFVRNKARRPPPPVDNRAILTEQVSDVLDYTIICGHNIG